MTTAEPDRLDRIERILESVAANQQKTDQQIAATAQQQQQTDQRIAAIAERQEQTDQQIAAIAQQQQQTNQRIAAIAERQEQTQRNIDELGQILRESIPDLTEMVGTVLMSLDEFSAELRSIFSSDAASRASERLAETRIRNEFRTAMLGLQTETRNILRELAELRQQRQNGNSPNQE